MLGFKEYQAEKKSNVLSIEVMKELFKESEKRMLSKLTDKNNSHNSYSADGISVIDPSISFLQMDQ